MKFASVYIIQGKKEMQTSCEEDKFYELMSRETFFDYMKTIYPWAYDYCYYYVFVVSAKYRSIIGTLQSIVDDDRDTFNERKAYYYLVKYEHKNLKFCIIIPTCNRPRAIDNILNVMAYRYRRLCVDLIIYDSSDNEKTEKLVKEIQSKGYYNIIYKRYDGIFDGFSLDHKIISAYGKYYDVYDYLWICRDGLIPAVEDLIVPIRYYKKKNIGCIIIDTKSRNKGIEIDKIYIGKKDCNIFLLEQADRLQTLGMLILSGKYAKKLLQNIPLTQKTYSLWQMAAPFHDFINNKNGVVFITRNVFEFNAMASNSHFWSKADKHFEQWAYRWMHVIDSMPREYDDVKNQCYMVYTVDFHPFSSGKILKMRSDNTYNYKILKKYKKYLPNVTRTPLWYFYFMAFIPVSLAKLIKLYAYSFFEKNRRIAYKYIDDNDF